MSNIITVKKGFDIKIIGEAENEILTPKVESYAIKPQDYIGLIPKMMVKEGDRVKAGSPIFYAKHNEKILFTSAVSGVVQSIKRGEKRVIEEVIIIPEQTQDYEDFGKESLASMNREDVLEKLLKSGLWTLIRKRPYAIIPNPDSSPKCIIVSGFDSSPLAANYNILLRGKAAEIQLGVDVLKKLTKGNIHVNVSFDKTTCDELLKLQGVEINKFKGQHPVGNISVQIAKLDPINKGESIWYIDAQDLAIIGKLFATGRVEKDRTIALVGNEVKNPRYYSVKLGASIANIVEKNVNKENNIRYISGTVLTGKTISYDGYLGAYDNLVSVITEGDYYEFLGWVLPGFKKFSLYRTFLSGFLNLLPKQKRKPINIDTNLHGGKRALVLTGEYEKVLPLDIYPMQLIKACIIGDIDLMEQLGIYEVDAEDFALCEVIDVSKTDIQQIIRDGLELMRKELGE
ncbi:MAG: Na(+)-translocating NADH-quinone reductase subunit A [Bacteroidales bacterium]|nr:Na(+)-translocating NADH-quinone reductase subunit A [Bacteroidales bacterium]